MTEGSRANLKRAIVSRLDSIAEEHRLGHQAAYANRYKMRSLHDAPIELMFEKHPKPSLICGRWQRKSPQFLKAPSLQSLIQRRTSTKFRRRAAACSMDAIPHWKT